MCRSGLWLLRPARGGIAGGPARTEGVQAVTFTRLELLFIRRLVVDQIAELERRLARYQRISAHYSEDVFQEKLALAEAELAAMRSAREKINNEIAVRMLNQDQHFNE